MAAIASLAFALCAGVLAARACTAAATTRAAAAAASATATTAVPGPGSALLVFVPAGEPELASVPGLSVGIMSASQGSYTATQLMLDITQGARVASSSYSQATPPTLSLQAPGLNIAGGHAVAGGHAFGGRNAIASGNATPGGVIAGWRAALRRAEDAPQLLRPGLLAARIQGGAAYAGSAGTDHIDAIVAADRDGRVATVSLGATSTLLSRIDALLRDKRLVVADLPGGSEGRADLRALSAGRAPNELLLVVQRARATRGHELLWAAAAGLPGGGGKTLTSQTTNERGLIAAVDLAPTILRRIDPTAAIPADMRGDRLRTDGALNSANLRSLMARLHVIGPRRLRALGCLLSAWALLMLLSAPWPRARAWSLRVGALGVLWAPVAVLIPAAIEPSAAVEYATIALACLALGALTDLLAPWPRAPLVPALVVVAALVADALAGTQLLARSLLGPNPILGARFYGIGNELKSALAVLVLAAVAATLHPVGARGCARGKRAAVTMGATGVVLAVVEGSARIGAGVGGVILVSAAFAIATVMLLADPGRSVGAVTRKRALLVLIAPVAGLVALAAIDLATAHGGGHFTGSVLHARSPGDVRDIIVRRYKAAWDELRNHAMPVATALALLCAWLGLRRRARLLAPVAGDPVWQAALAGGLTAGVVGALVEDSGPVLLVVATFTLICVLGYLWGRPREPSQASDMLDG